MRAAVIYGGVFDDLHVICPFCDLLVEEYRVDYDDYVGDNCFVYCQCRSDFLLCTTGTLRQEFGWKPDESPECDCTEQMNSDEVSAVCKKFGIDEPARGYRAGVLKLVFVLPSEHIPDTEDEDEYIRAAYDGTIKGGYRLNDSCFTLNQARKMTGDRLAHDGILLGYAGECSECGKVYVSSVSGD